MTIPTGDRFDREREFHDKKYSVEGGGPRIYKVSPTYEIFKELKVGLGDLSDKVVLEIGCGTGWITAELASAGAHVIACDISPEAIARTKALLHRHGLSSRCELLTGPVETLKLNAQSVDIVVGFAILHHLDLEQTLDRVIGLLKPGGKLVAAEPLATNPLIEGYRRLTPQFRTADERPLDLADFRSRFQSRWKIKHAEFYLTALLPLMLAYMPKGDAMYRMASPAFWRMDRRILSRWPKLGRYAWYTILEMSPL